MRGRPIRLIISLATVLIVIAFILSGCSMASAAEAFEKGTVSTTAADFFNGSDARSQSPEAMVESEIAMEEGAAAVDNTGVSPELYTQAGSADSATSQVVSTKLIKNGSIQIEVEKGQFQKKFFEVMSIAEKYKGYVSNSQSYSDSEGNMTNGFVTIRIAKENFDIVLDKIKEMGTVDSVSTNVQDVTQEYVDNESRLTNLEAQQKRLLELMDQSVNVKDSIEVQRELSNVEGQIEIIRGRQNYLDNLVAYSTLDVYITEPQPITDSPEGGFLGAMKRGARGALTVLRVVTMVLIAISPIIVIIGIILIIIWQSLRARNRKRARQKKIEEQQNK